MSKHVTMPGNITLNVLLSALRSAVDSRRIGTPVNARIHWQFFETDMKHAALVSAQIADEVLALEAPVWRVRTENPEASMGRILNVLGEDRRGRTVLITLCRGETREFALTVFGNHGTLRLEHAGLDESSLDAGDADADWWASLADAIG